MKNGMKVNKLISVLLVLALLLSMFTGVTIDFSSTKTVFADDEVTFTTGDGTASDSAYQISTEAQLIEFMGTLGGYGKLTAAITLTETITIPTGKTVYLETNDKIVTYTGSGNFAIVNSGTLTITGDSTTNTGTITLNTDNITVAKSASDSEFVLAASNALGFIKNIGTLDVSDVTFYTESTSGAETSTDSSGNTSDTDSDGVILGTGGSVKLTNVNVFSMDKSTLNSITAVWMTSGVEKFEVQGGNFVNASQNDTGYNGYTMTTSAKVSIIEPTEVFGRRGGFSAMGGETTIDGGTYGADYQYSLYFNGETTDATVKINGGTFNESLTADNVAYISARSSMDGIFVTINNGTFYGTFLIDIADVDFMEINGGYFEDTFEFKSGTNSGIYINEGSTVLNLLGDNVTEITLNLTSATSIIEDITIPENATVTITTSNSSTLTIDSGVNIFVLDDAELVLTDVSVSNDGTIYTAGTGKVTGYSDDDENPIVGGIIAKVETTASSGSSYHSSVDSILGVSGTLTVTLLDDIAEDEISIASKIVTIDLNGHNLTINKSFEASAISFASSYTVTINNSSTTGNFSISEDATISSNIKMYFNCDVVNSREINNTGNMYFKGNVTNSSGAEINNTGNMYFNCNVVNYATITNGGWLAFDGVTITNSGTIANNLYCGVYDVIVSSGTITNNDTIYCDVDSYNFITGSVAYYYCDDDSEYCYYSTLANAISDAGSNTVYICEDITVAESSAISIAKDITITGLTGDE
ncbi:MAG: hypothetical protein R3Y18_02340, partial [Bacillota bacterium]